VNSRALFELARDERMLSRPRRRTVVVCDKLLRETSTTWNADDIR
jgi:hypothetical protein